MSLWNMEVLLTCLSVLTAAEMIFNLFTTQCSTSGCFHSYLTTLINGLDPLNLVLLSISAIFCKKYQDKKLLELHSWSSKMFKIQTVAWSWWLITDCSKSLILFSREISRTNNSSMRSKILDQFLKVTFVYWVHLIST